MRIVLDGCRRAFSDHGAVVQHKDLVRNVHDERHVVFDQENGGPGVPDLAYQFSELVGLAHIEAAGRLIQQQKVRIRSQGARELDHAALPEGKRARHPRRAACEADVVDPRHCRVSNGAFFPALPRRFQTAPGELAPRTAMLAHHHVLEHAYLKKQARILKRARHTRLCDLVGLEPADVLSLESHAARFRLEQAGNHIEQSGLSGAVGADDRLDLALVHIERNVVHRDHAPEGPAHVFYFKQRHVRSLPPRTSAPTTGE